MYEKRMILEKFVDLATDRELLEIILFVVMTTLNHDIKEELLEIMNTINKEKYKEENKDE